MFHTGSVLGNLQIGECLEKLRCIFPVLESLWEAYFYCFSDVLESLGIS